MSDNKSTRTPLATNKKLVRLLCEANRTVRKLQLLLSLDNIADVYGTSKANIEYHLQKYEKEQAEKGGK